MNYLAHLFLSGPEAGVRVGNFIGDYVKGSNFTRYTPAIRKGIILHRQIDTFTDKHPIFRESSKHFQPMYGRYAGVVTDIAYDHFLAANWSLFSEQPLKNFVTESHLILMMNYFSLPGAVKQFLPFLIKSRRMEHYNSLDGFEKTLRIMAGHSSLPNHAEWAMTQIHANYEQLKNEFIDFFAEVSKMSQAHLESAIASEHQAKQL
jgi:acyl carrier protein phosphodiesterase